MHIISLAGLSDRANSSFNHFFFFKALSKPFLLRLTSHSELLLRNPRAAFVFERCQNFGNLLIAVLRWNHSHCCNAEPRVGAEVATKFLGVWEWRMLLGLHVPPLPDPASGSCVLTWCSVSPVLGSPAPPAFFQSMCVAGSVALAGGRNTLLCL